MLDIAQGSAILYTYMLEKTMDPLTIIAIYTVGTVFGLVVGFKGGIKFGGETLLAALIDGKYVKTKIENGKEVIIPYDSSK